MGTHMPYTGVVKSWKGWVTTNSTASNGTIVAIYKYTPVEDDDSNVSLVLVKAADALTASGTGTDNSKLQAITIASDPPFPVGFTAGDILISAIKVPASSNVYFTSMLEVEFN